MLVGWSAQRIHCGESLVMWLVWAVKCNIARLPSPNLCKSCDACDTPAAARALRTSAVRRLEAKQTHQCILPAQAALGTSVVSSGASSQPSLAVVVHG